MDLLYHPQPLEDEWLGSWIVRLATGNMISTKRFMELIGLSSPEPVPSEEFIDLLAKAAKCTRQQIEETIVWPQQSRTSNGIFGMENAHPFVGVKILQICPHCLADDSTPYIRKRWIMKNTVQCEHHGGPMLERCPQCNRYIKIYLPIRSERHFFNSIASLDTLDNFLNCTYCHKRVDFPTQKTRFLPTLPNLTEENYHSLSDQIVDWQGFTESLIKFIAAFSLTDITMYLHDKMPQLNIQSAKIANSGFVPLPIHRSNPFTAQNRFSHEALYRKLLDVEPGSNPLILIYEFSARLCYHISGYRVVSSRRWRYVAWLSLLLSQPSSASQVQTWSELVRLLSWVFLNDDPLFSEDVAPNFLLCDEYWCLVHHVLQQGQLSDKFVFEIDRAAFEAYLYTIRANIGWKYLPKMFGDVREVKIHSSKWSDDLKEAALTQLYYHFTSQFPDILRVTSSSELLSSHRTMANFFLSENVINYFFVRKNPIYREILEILSQLSKFVPHT